jgi:hypothetical protein
MGYNHLGASFANGKVIVGRIAGCNARCIAPSRPPMKGGAARRRTASYGLVQAELRRQGARIS